MSEDLEANIQQWLDGEEPEPPERKDRAEIKDRCVAKTASGDRCKNAVTHMHDGPFCSSHAQTDDVQVVVDSAE